MRVRATPLWHYIKQVNAMQRNGATIPSIQQSGKSCDYCGKYPKIDSGFKKASGLELLTCAMETSFAEKSTSSSSTIFFRWWREDWIISWRVIFEVSNDLLQLPMNFSEYGPAKWYDNTETSVRILGLRKYSENSSRICYVVYWCWFLASFEVIAKSVVGSLRLVAVSLHFFCLLKYFHH